MKKFKVMAIVLAFGIILSGCNMVEVNPERDRDTVIAKVNDEVVTKGEYLDQYAMYEMYGYFPADFATNPKYDGIYEEQVKMLVDSLVDMKVSQITARNKGCYDFTEEQKQEIEEQVNSTLGIYISMYEEDLKALPENEGKTDEEITKLATDNIDTFFAENAFGITVQDLYDEQETTLAQENLYELASASVTVSDEEVKAEYDARVEDKKIAYETMSANFEQDANGADPLYYIPENARQAQHILISISEEIQEAIAELEESGEEKLAEIKREEGLREIEAAVNDAYQRALAGEDFEALIEELGQDPGMESNDYYTVTNPTQTYVEEFASAVFELQSVGDISEPVATDFGYHIIKFYGEMESGPVPYEDVYESIYDELLQQAKDAKFAEEFEIWRQEVEIKTFYNRVLEN